MKLYATTTSERATKGQGGEYLEIEVLGSYQTSLINLTIKPDGARYRLTGWTHDNHRIDIMINENIGRQKGEKKKDNGGHIGDSDKCSPTCKTRREYGSCPPWPHA